MGEHRTLGECLPLPSLSKGSALNHLCCFQCLREQGSRRTRLSE